jgi:hypothetical protein
MPLPKPKNKEKKDEFIQRCMTNAVMEKEYPDNDQRLAVCNTQWSADMNSNSEQMQSLVHNMSQLVQKKEMDGVEYLVAPTVMIVEGVLNNRLYTAEEISKNVQLWNGRPVIIDHSTDGLGRPKSANDPEEREKRTVGWLYNASYDAANKKLKAEAWIDPEKCNKVEGGDVVIDKLETNQPIEVSTGLFGTDKEGKGIFNNTEYSALCVDIQPDHLALLPYDEGACNWDDGAGLPRINKKEKGAMATGKLNQLFENLKKKMKLVNNETSMNDVQRQLVDALVAEYENGPENQWVWIVEIFPESTTVVFTVEKADSYNLYSTKYSVEKGRAILSDNNVQEVVMKTEYVAINNNKEGDVRMNKAQMIEQLITNGYDKEAVEGLSEDILGKLVALKENQDKLAEVEKKLEENKQVETTKETTETAEVKENKGEPLKFNSQDDVLDALPEGELKENFQEALALRKAERERLIENLKKNERNEFTEDELNAMKLNQLRRTAKLANVSVFAGAEGGPTPVVNKNDAPPMPTINWSEK